MCPSRRINTVISLVSASSNFGIGWRAAAVLCLVAECLAALSVQENFVRVHVICGTSPRIHGFAICGLKIFLHAHL
jgi:hypothetical protein